MRSLEEVIFEECFDFETENDYELFIKFYMWMADGIRSDIDFEVIPEDWYSMIDIIEENIKYLYNDNGIF